MLNLSHITNMTLNMKFNNPKRLANRIKLCAKLQAGSRLTEHSLQQKVAEVGGTQIFMIGIGKALFSDID